LAIIFQESAFLTFKTKNPTKLEVGLASRRGQSLYDLKYYYDHCLKLPEHTKILWFDGGHVINHGKIRISPEP
jgi:hypothetical protein